MTDNIIRTDRFNEARKAQELRQYCDGLLSKFNKRRTLPQWNDAA